ncbi:MAG: DUF2007 domain-containing protein [Bacteroidetes bacterium]|nr:DUF2007 domain-containing protein [Bacteroidota bacterium]MCL6101460.1 DUF2007 domain-containing protein [Bacteroidota bacterium]
MEKSWKKIYFSGDEFKVLIARDLLAESGINAVIMNQKDSSYTTFGDVELYIEGQDEKEALQILDQLIKGEI